MTPDPPGPRRRRPTATSAYGVSRRESHDASAFYARFGAPDISADDLVNPPKAVNEIWVGDARAMDTCGDVADASVALVVTSPPYFAGKEYEQALGDGHIPATYQDYLITLEDVFAECVRKLEPGGRIAVNVANLGRKPYRSLSGDVTTILQDRLGLLVRGEIIWWKAHAAGGSCAWGTYQRPGNPVLRDLTERVVVASKGRFDRAITATERARQGMPCEGSMSMDEFVDATTDVWDIAAESATRVGHPAPFPVELPRRLIELYTYRGDLVLDPFMGSGSTAVAAVRTERAYVGFDTDADYVARAKARVAAEQAEPSPSGASQRIVVPAAQKRPGKGAGNSADPAAIPAAFRQGRKAREVARLVLEAAGFGEIEDHIILRDLGLELAFRARDGSGGRWLFDLAGAFSVTRPGLRRSDNIWRVLAKAAVLQAAAAARPNAGTVHDLGPLVVLTTDAPIASTPAGRALALAVDTEAGPIHDVIEFTDPVALARLRGYAASAQSPR
jgi:DNA modification methylase